MRPGSLTPRPSPSLLLRWSVVRAWSGANLLQPRVCHLRIPQVELEEVRFLSGASSFSPASVTGVWNRFRVVRLSSAASSVQARLRHLGGGQVEAAEVREPGQVRQARVRHLRACQLEGGEFLERGQVRQATCRTCVVARRRVVRFWGGRPPARVRHRRVADSSSVVRFGSGARRLRAPRPCHFGARQRERVSFLSAPASSFSFLPRPSPWWLDSSRVSEVLECEPAPSAPRPSPAFCCRLSVVSFCEPGQLPSAPRPSPCVLCRSSEVRFLSAASSFRPASVTSALARLIPTAGRFLVCGQLF